MALAPPLVITLGLIALLVIAGYWLMKPTVHANPGVAAYAPPAAAARVLDYAGEDKSVAVERAANEVAEGENKKLGVARSAVAGQGLQGIADQPSTVAAAPKQNAARIQRRQDAPGQSRSRPPPQEPAPFSAFARGWFGRF